MKNHLFIGLGGQGGRSLAEIRKVIAQREKEAAALKNDHRVKWSFLSIDSSSDVWNESAQWSYFGEDLSLGDHEKRDLKRIRASQSISSLAVRRDVSPWLGDRSTLERFVEENGEIEGANQKRRFGRLLLANTANKVRDAISERTRDLTQQAEQTCAFHVFASLAGGTGSGGIVDLVTLIRSRFPDRDVASGFPIFLYLYLTSDDLKGADVGYFFQNQYAAIRDINALICGRFKPTLLGEGGGQPADCTDAVAQVMLSTDLNSNNYELSIETQTRIVAEGCFERIHAWAAGNMSADTQRSLTGQDIIASFKGEPTVRPERSYRFSSMGMRRWEVPHARVNELLALDVEVSSLRQMLYNHWDREKGFTETSASLDATASQVYLGKIADLIRPYLLDGSERGRSLNEELRKGLGEHTVGILNSVGDEHSLSALDENFKRFVNEEYQSSGWSAFFAQESLHRSSHVTEAESKIDSYLSRLWLDPTNPVGMDQIIDLLQKQCAKLRSETEGESPASTTNEKISKRLQKRENEWEKITALSALAGKKRALLRAHAQDITAAYVQKLSDEFRQADREFLKALLATLSRNLKNSYQKSYDRLEGLLDEATKERNSLATELENLEVTQSSNKYEFDRDALRSFRNDMQRAKDQQIDAAGAMREQFVNPDDSHHLSILDSRVRQDRERFKIQMQSSSMNSAKIMHRELITNEDDSIIQESLMDRLEDRFNGNETQLLNEIREFVNLAASSMNQRSEEEIQPAEILGGDGRGVVPMPRRLFVLGLPNHSYSGVVEEKFKSVIPPGERFIFDLYRHDDPSQLRLLLVDYWMAARFATVIHNLHSKFSGVDGAPGAEDTRYFCNIDPSGERGERPSLLMRTAEKMREALEAELWLAQRPEIGAVKVDERGAFLISESEDGTNSEKLAQTLDELVNLAGISEMHKVHSVVSSKIQSLSEEELAKLTEAVKNEEARIKSEVGVTDPEFQKWMALRKEISNLLKTT